MKNLLMTLDARLGEPSTYASLAAMLTLAHVSVDPGVMHTLSTVGIIAAGVMGVFMAEVGKKPVAQIAADAVAALIAGVKALPSSDAKPVVT